MMAAVLGMARLFVGGGGSVRLTVSAFAAHGLAALLPSRVGDHRRRGHRGRGRLRRRIGPLHVAGIPTGDTWSAMQDDLDSAWRLYQDVSAPTPAEPGFGDRQRLADPAVAYIADRPPSACGCPSRRRFPRAPCSSSPA